MTHLKLKCVGLFALLGIAGAVFLKAPAGSPSVVRFSSRLDALTWLATVPNLPTQALKALTNSDTKFKSNELASSATLQVMWSEFAANAQRSRFDIHFSTSQCISLTGLTMALPAVLTPGNRVWVTHPSNVKLFSSDYKYSMIENRKIEITLQADCLSHLTITSYK